MKTLQLIEIAEKKVGGLNELARMMKYHAPALSNAKKGNRPLPPYRAAQLAEIVGDCPEQAYLEASKEQAKDAGEKALLGKMLRGFKSSGLVLTIALALAGTGFYEKNTVIQATSGICGKIYIMPLARIKAVFRGAS